MESDQVLDGTDNDPEENYCSSFSRIRRSVSNSECFGHLTGPFSSGKAIALDFSAAEIHVSISSAVAVTNAGSQPMP
jgi:hypothetical protein